MGTPRQAQHDCPAALPADITNPPPTLPRQAVRMGVLSAFPPGGWWTRAPSCVHALPGALGPNSPQWTDTGAPSSRAPSTPGIPSPNADSFCAQHAPPRRGQEHTSQWHPRRPPRPALPRPGIPALRAPQPSCRQPGGGPGVRLDTRGRAGCRLHTRPGHRILPPAAIPPPGAFTSRTPAALHIHLRK